MVAAANEFQFSAVYSTAAAAATGSIFVPEFDMRHKTAGKTICLFVRHTKKFPT